jgi:Uma2 family endonuclease
MSPETITDQVNSILDPVDWEPPMPPTDLIFDDGEPLESNRHRIAMNVLIRSLQNAWADRDDFYTGGNMFVYYSRTQAKNREFRGPDFFAVRDVDGTVLRQGWVVWEEEGRYPDIIVELLSESTAQIDKTAKKDLYERVFKTRDYFIYDPFDSSSLKGWHLDAHQKYQPLTPNPEGWLWSETLGFWLGTWEGVIDREPAHWLRFYDPTDHLVLLPEEFAQQRAEQEQQRAEQEQQRAEQAEERLGQEQAAKLAAIARLSEMGLTVEQIAEALSLPLKIVQSGVVAD